MPNSTPFGLIRTTCPFAFRLPRIRLGSTPVTRLTASDEDEGWLNTVVSPEPIEKLFQSITARADDWFTSSCPGDTCTIEADPPTT